MGNNRFFKKYNRKIDKKGSIERYSNEKVKNEVSIFGWFINLPK